MESNYNQSAKKFVVGAGQGGETWYDRIRWFGLFSVPAPPFRFTASGGVFIFLGLGPSATIVLFPDSRCTCCHESQVLVVGRPCRPLEPARLTLFFDADRPAEGLTKIVVLDRPWSGGRLLGVTGSIQSAATTTLADWHVRGDDLIAVYEMGRPDAARLDLLWHVGRPATDHEHTVPAPWLARLDLLVSVPPSASTGGTNVRLESLLPAVTADENAKGSDPGLCSSPDSLGSIFHAAAQGWSLAVMVHPADIGRQELTAEAGPSTACRLQQQLFRTQSLEKGVILRARARAWFLPSGFGRTAAAACFAEFVAADPPLGI